MYTSKINQYLGQRIKVFSKYKRVHKYDSGHVGIRIWKETPINTDGIIIGFRTLSNGTVTYNEEGAYFNPSDHFRAILVVSNVNNKPYFVPYEAIYQLNV
jgi:hypothetical protein